MGRYYSRLLCVAFTHAPGPIDLWTGLVTAVIGVADHYVPHAYLVTKYAWQIPLWAFAAVIAVRLILAPFWMAQEDTVLIADLQKRLDDRDARQKAIDALWLLRRTGVALRNQELDDSGLAAWTQAAKDWRDEVLKEANKLSPNLRNHLEILNETGKPPGNITYRDDNHYLWVRQLSEMLRRIERYLEKDL